MDGPLIFSGDGFCGAPPALQATPEYRRALESLGLQVLTLDLHADGIGVGTAQIVLRRFPAIGVVAWLPLGPTWTRGTHPDQRRAALAWLARDLPLTGARVWVSVAPDLAADTDFTSAGHLRLRPGRWTAGLDLTPPPATLRDRLSVKWRNALTKAERGPLHVRHRSMPADPMHWLLRASAADQARQGWRGWPDALTFSWITANPGQARLWQADLDGRPVAGMLILQHGRGATYHIGWTGPEGRRHGAHTLLLWRAMTWARREGTVWLDLGIADPDRTPGLARFKRGTGAGLLQSGATWLHQPALAAIRRGASSALAFCRIAV